MCTKSGPLAFTEHESSDNQNVSPKDSHGSSIFDWGLIPILDDEPPFLETMQALMKDKLPADDQWTHHHIYRNNTELTRYSVTASGAGYITTQANFLDAKGKRRTGMKLRDMIMANLRRAGPDFPKNLQILGLNAVTNDDALEAVESTFDIQKKDFEADEIQVELASYPCKSGWAPIIAFNPLLDGQLKMVYENKEELGGARIEKVVVLVKNVPSLKNQRGVFIATHLTREPED